MQGFIAIEMTVPEAEGCWRLWQVVEDGIVTRYVDATGAAFALPERCQMRVVDTTLRAEIEVA